MVTFGAAGGGYQPGAGRAGGYCGYDGGDLSGTTKDLYFRPDWAYIQSVNCPISDGTVQRKKAPMILSLLFLLAAFALIVALAPLARGRPFAALSGIEHIKTVPSIPRHRAQHTKCGRPASIFVNRSLTARRGFSLAAGGVAA